MDESQVISHFLKNINSRLSEGTIPLTTNRMPTPAFADLATRISAAYNNVQIGDSNTYCLMGGWSAKVPSYRQAGQLTFYNTDDGNLYRAIVGIDVPLELKEGKKIPRLKLKITFKDGVSNCDYSLGITDRGYVFAPFEEDLSREHRIASESLPLSWLLPPK